MDLIASLHDALKPRKEGYTVCELCTLAKLPVSHTSKLKIRAFLKHEIEAGRIRPQNGRRIAIDGNERTIPIYLPVDPKQR